MIVQETRIKASSGHQAVSRHVLSGARNEAIRLTSGSDYLLKDWMKEARREGIRYGLRHIAFNPSEAMTDQQLSDFAEDICRELEADPERTTFVIHQNPRASLVAGMARQSRSQHQILVGHSRD
ncbi:hypothetical protein [Acetobacter thailandicus]|uniref:Uncharacterized protein n=1 Tax=Acetobacter thailandicus TaxID=1502842 RepID=A0ABT3QCL0_9PROT|nr:hypothetical protein [Acetobacter thailandicus]MCX2562999.1 hypothetical protein [Acetobacter thailandicus]NHN96231.1 hypothetical protein [Acetobacter thailandicus]